MTQQKHVERSWAIEMTAFNGKKCFAWHQDNGNCRCTFSTEASAAKTLREWEPLFESKTAVVVRVEIRTL